MLEAGSLYGLRWGFFHLKQRSADWFVVVVFCLFLNAS